MSNLKLIHKKIHRKACKEKMRILRLCHRSNHKYPRKNYDKQSVLIPPL
jgi:hypothetical protein